MATLTAYSFVGLSSEIKPSLSLDGTAPVPAGSTFREQDTGRVFYWSGTAWVLQQADPDPSSANAPADRNLRSRLDAYLAALLLELRALRLTVCQATAQPFHADPPADLTTTRA